MLSESVPAIRLLPMSESDPEFTEYSIGDMQEWFINELPYRVYNYKTEMITPLGTLVLFQYKNSVVASAYLVDKVIYEGKIDGGYKGAFVFDPSTIAVFKPINKEEMKGIWSDFKNFSQSMKKLDASKNKTLVKLVNKKNIRYALKGDLEEDEYQRVVETINLESATIVEDIPQDKIEGNYSIITNRWKRNYIKAKNAIIQSGFQCEYDPTHMFFRSNSTGQNYVEAHHLIPMEFQEIFDYSIDVEANIISLCPLCHKKVHHATIEEKKPVLDKLHSERKIRLDKLNAMNKYYLSLTFINSGSQQKKSLLVF